MPGCCRRLCQNHRWPQGGKSSCETFLQLLIGQWFPGKEATVPVYQHRLLAQDTECLVMNLSDI